MLVKINDSLYINSDQVKVVMVSTDRGEPTARVFVDDVLVAVFDGEEFVSEEECNISNQRVKEFAQLCAARTAAQKYAAELAEKMGVRKNDNE